MSGKPTAEALAFLGRRGCGAGQFDEAVRSCREAIRLQPDFAPAWNNLAAALDGKGELDEALRAMREAVRLRKDSVTSLNGLAVILGKLGRLDEAERTLRAAMRLQPKDASIWSHTA